LLGLTSGALAARMAELQVLLIPVSVLSLGLAHYVAYRKGAASPWQRTALWGGTLIAIATWLSALLAE
jgi:hypothetical protein